MYVYVYVCMYVYTCIKFVYFGHIATTCILTIRVSLFERFISTHIVMATVLITEVSIVSIVVGFTVTPKVSDLPSIVIIG